MIKKLHTLTDQAIANYASSARSYCIGKALQAIASPSDQAPPFLRGTVLTDSPSHASYVSDGMGAWVAYWGDSDEYGSIVIAWQGMQKAYPMLSKVLYLVHVMGHSMEHIAVLLGKSERRVYQMKEEGEKRLIGDIAPSSLYVVVKDASILALVYCALPDGDKIPLSGGIAA